MNDMDDKLKILLVEDDTRITNEFQRIIVQFNDFYLLDTCNESEQAINQILNLYPDVVILDLELHRGGGNGLAVLKAIQEQNMVMKPFFLITTNNSSETTHEAVRQLGADFIMCKYELNYTSLSALEFIDTMKATLFDKRNKLVEIGHNLESPDHKSIRIHAFIEKELNFIGINPKVKGYNYLVESICYGATANLDTMTDHVATLFKKSKASVTRAMQNAINNTWTRQEINLLTKHYTAIIRSANGTPSLLEFQCYYVNKTKHI